jgi:hypothetical protein
MPLSSRQITDLRAAIFATPAAAALLNARDTAGLLTWCNAATATRRWMSAAPVLEIEEAPVYTDYATFTQGARDSWALFLRNPRDFGRNKVRQWVTSIWGNATTGSNAEAIFLAGSVIATNAQVALGGTSRNTGTVVALASAYEELIDSGEVERVAFRNNGQLWTAG